MSRTEIMRAISAVIALAAAILGLLKALIEFNVQLPLPRPTFENPIIVVFVSIVALYLLLVTVGYWRIEQVHRGFADWVTYLRKFYDPCAVELDRWNVDIVTPEGDSHVERTLTVTNPTNQPVFTRKHEAFADVPVDDRTFNLQAYDAQGNELNATVIRGVLSSIRSAIFGNSSKSKIVAVNIGLQARGGPYTYSYRYYWPRAFRKEDYFDLKRPAISERTEFHLKFPQGTELNEIKCEEVLPEAKLSIPITQRGMDSGRGFATIIIERPTPLAKHYIEWTYG